MIKKALKSCKCSTSKVYAHRCAVRDIVVIALLCIKECTHRLAWRHISWPWIQAYIKLPQHLRPGVNDLEGRLRGAWITPHEKDRDQYVLNEVGRQGRRAHNF